MTKPPDEILDMVNNAEQTQDKDDIERARIELRRWVSEELKNATGEDIDVKTPYRDGRIRVYIDSHYLSTLLPDTELRSAMRGKGRGEIAQSEYFVIDRH